MSASPAQHRFFMETVLWPNLLLSAADSFMAFEAWKIFLAAKEFDGDAVDGGMVMGATCFSVHLNAFYSMMVGHIKSSFLKRA